MPPKQAQLPEHHEQEELLAKNPYLESAKVAGEHFSHKLGRQLAVKLPKAFGPTTHAWIGNSLLGVGFFCHLYDEQQHHNPHAMRDALIKTGVNWHIDCFSKICCPMWLTSKICEILEEPAARGAVLCQTLAAFYQQEQQRAFKRQDFLSSFSLSQETQYLRQASVILNAVQRVGQVSTAVREKLSECVIHYADTHLTCHTVPSLPLLSGFNGALIHFPLSPQLTFEDEVSHHVETKIHDEVLCHAEVETNDDSPHPEEGLPVFTLLPKEEAHTRLYAGSSEASKKIEGLFFNLKATAESLSVGLTAQNNRFDFGFHFEFQGTETLITEFVNRAIGCTLIKNKMTIDGETYRYCLQSSGKGLERLDGKHVKLMVTDVSTGKHQEKHFKLKTFDLKRKKTQKQINEYLTQLIKPLHEKKFCEEKARFEQQSIAAFQTHDVCRAQALCDAFYTKYCGMTGSVAAKQQTQTIINQTKDRLTLEKIIQSVDNHDFDLAKNMCRHFVDSALQNKILTEIEEIASILNTESDHAHHSLTTVAQEQLQQEQPQDLLANVEQEPTQDLSINAEQEPAQDLLLNAAQQEQTQDLSIHIEQEPVSQFFEKQYFYMQTVELILDAMHASKISSRFASFSTALSCGAKLRAHYLATAIQQASHHTPSNFQAMIGRTHYIEPGLKLLLLLTQSTFPEWNERVKRISTHYLFPSVRFLTFCTSLFEKPSHMILLPLEHVLAIPTISQFLCYPHPESQLASIRFGLATFFTHLTQETLAHDHVLNRTKSLVQYGHHYSQTIGTWLKMVLGRRGASLANAIDVLPAERNIAILLRLKELLSALWQTQHDLSMGAWSGYCQTHLSVCVEALSLYQAGQVEKARVKFQEIKAALKTLSSDVPELRARYHWMMLCAGLVEKNITLSEAKPSLFHAVEIYTTEDAETLNILFMQYLNTQQIEQPVTLVCQMRMLEKMLARPMVVLSSQHIPDETLAGDPIYVVYHEQQYYTVLLRGEPYFEKQYAHYLEREAATQQKIMQLQEETYQQKQHAFEIMMQDYQQQSLELDAAFEAAQKQCSLMNASKILFFPPSHSLKQTTPSQELSYANHF